MDNHMDDVLQRLQEQPGVVDTTQLSAEEFEQLKALNLRPAQRPAIAWWVYGIAFIFVVFIAIGLLQWSVWTVEPLQGYGGFIGKAFTGKGELQFFLNFLLISALYGILIALTNRFWSTSAFLLLLVGFCAVVERLKVGIRFETVKPSDLDFLKHDAGNMFDFTPPGLDRLIAGAAMFTLTVLVIVYSLAHRDGRKYIIRTRIRALGIALRAGIAAVLAALLALFTIGVSTAGSPANRFATAFGDSPKLWDSVIDAQANGTLMGFLRFVNPKVMEEPSDYSQATMNRLVRKYANVAHQINESRAYNMNDSTVIMVLSESFSDPTRVPGLQLNQDPIPQIRQIKQNTTSGYMLSAGYGGGTANMEFMAMTGLSMANFDASLSSPYQQLIPKLSWIPTVNRMWDNGKESQAFHPYEASMYSREGNYKKFGFTHFWTLNKPDVIAHQERIDSSPYVNDSSAYQSLLEKIDINKSQFLSVLTMQNHMSYDNWYSNNQFVASSTTGMPLGLDETQQIQTYAKGINYTDNETQVFLNQLDNINKPITVIFYGDHLPGVYATAGRDDNNSVALHETDYFIWSNKASASAGTKLPDSTALYTSPNFFMAQAAEHMNAKVSPYLAFLTALHAKVPAMEPPVVNKIQGWSRIPDGQAIYLDAQGNRVDIRQADKETQELLHDYQLIQYDITAGEGYLKDTAFMSLPKDTSAQEQQIAPGTKNAGETPAPDKAAIAARAKQQAEQAAKEQATEQAAHAQNASEQSASEQTKPSDTQAEQTQSEQTTTGQ